MDNRHLPWRRVVREKGVICRVCAGYREYSFNIFISTDAFNIPVFRLLRDLLNVEVEEGDGLPDTICRLCVNKLVEFHEFKQIYASSETELRKHNEFKWLLEEEGRPLEEFAEEESFVEDGSQGESAANLKNGIGIVHPVKEEEVERNTGAAEEMKRENDAVEDLNSGRTSTMNVDPFRADLRESLSSSIKFEECWEDNVSETDCLATEIAGFDTTSTSSVNEVDQSCEIVGIPETLDDEFGNSADEAVVITGDNSPCDISHVLLRKETSITSDISKQYPLRITNRQEKKRANPNDLPMSIPQVKDTSTPKKKLMLRHLNDNRRITDDCMGYICDYCGNKYRNINSLAYHIKDHTSEKMSSALGLPKKHLSPRSSSILQLKKRRNLTPTISGISRGNVKPAVSTKLQILRSKNSFEGEGHGRELRHRKKQVSSAIFNERAFKCKRCGNVFRKKCRLLRNSKINAGLEPLCCDKCGDKFNGRSNLRKPANIPSNQKDLQCDICNKVFNNKGALKKHAFIHTGLKPFECSICGNKFNARSSLKRHISVHSGSKGFKCELCGKAFKLLANLKLHSVIHSDLKPFECDKCGKAFKRRDTLKLHTATHSETKAYTCNECGKGFHQRSSLARHTNIHSGLKPFKCDVCGMLYAHRQNFKRHLALHNVVKP